MVQTFLLTSSAYKQNVGGHTCNNRSRSQDCNCNDQSGVCLCRLLYDCICSRYNDCKGREVLGVKLKMLTVVGNLCAVNDMPRAIIIVKQAYEVYKRLGRQG